MNVLHTCIYLYFLRHLYLYAFFLSLAFPRFLFLSHNCLWSVPSEYQCAAVSLETVRRERRAGYSEGVFMMLALLPNALLISMCAFTCMAHVQKCVSEGLSFYLREFDEILPVIVCFPCTCLRGCAGWMPAVSSSSLPSSSLLFLALLSDSVSGITAEEC